MQRVVDDFIVSLCLNAVRSRPESKVDRIKGLATRTIDQYPVDWYVDGSSLEAPEKRRITVSFGVPPESTPRLRADLFEATDLVFEAYRDVLNRHVHRTGERIRSALRAEPPDQTEIEGSLKDILGAGPPNGQSTEDSAPKAGLLSRLRSSK